MDSNKKDKFTPFGSDWLIGQSSQSSSESGIVKDIYDGSIFEGVKKQELLDLADEIYQANPTKDVSDVIQRIFKAIKLEWTPNDRLE